MSLETAWLLSLRMEVCGRRQSFALNASYHGSTLVSQQAEWAYKIERALNAVSEAATC